MSLAPDHPRSQIPLSRRGAGRIRMTSH
ncbi:hypothetical protein FF1_008153 [Malus domestica]